MKILLKWSDRTIIEFVKSNNLYIACTNYDEVINAKAEGLMIGLLSQIQIVSPSLPKLILNRIPDALQNDCIGYIKETQCRCNTDKFSVEIVE